MPTVVDWRDITIRLLLSGLAGGVIGFNRGEHGRPAGLRTTILVTMAAATAMVLANLLMSAPGPTPPRLVRADVLRLPLGILSGIGFIGAGAIVRRGNVIGGVTTAATLWYVTVMGLCFGSGQLALGGASFAMGWCTLWGLKLIEGVLPHDRIATLEVCLDAGPTEEALRTAVTGAGFRIVSAEVTYESGSRRRALVWSVQWRERGHSAAPAFLEEFAGRPTVHRVAWRPHETGGRA